MTAPTPSVEQQLETLKQQLEAEYAEYNGVPTAPVPPQIQDRPMQDITEAAAVTNLCFNAYGGELQAALQAQQIAQGGVPPSAQQTADIASRVLMRHAPELYREQAVLDGHAVNARQLPTAYVEHLHKLGATDADVIEVAQRLFPNLDRREALKRWEQQAQKVNYDLRYGDTKTPYGGVPVRESTD